MNENRKGMFLAERPEKIKIDTQKRQLQKDLAKEASDKAQTKLKAIDEDATKNVLAGQMRNAIVTIGSRVNPADPNSMYAGFLEYEKFCDMAGVPMFSHSAYAAMGITKEEADALKEGKGRGVNPRFAEILGEVDRTCRVDLEIRMAMKLITPTLAIWYQKNFAGMSDYPEEKKADERRIEDTRSAAEIKAKYQDEIDD